MQFRDTVCIIVRNSVDDQHVAYRCRDRPIVIFGVVLVKCKIYWMTATALNFVTVGDN